MTRSWRGVSVVLLCEDRQQAAFVRRFLGHVGVHRRKIRQLPFPAGTGAGEQSVRKRFPIELRTQRRLATRTILIAVIDADTSDPAQRRRQLDMECERLAVPLRGPREHVAILVPNRNIETWIAWLDGQTVDETTVYSKLPREKDCARQVRRLWELCDSGTFPEEAPESLTDACSEWNARCRSALD